MRAKALRKRDLLCQMSNNQIQHFEVSRWQLVDQFVHLMHALIQALLFCIKGYKYLSTFLDP